MTDSSNQLQLLYIGLERYHESIQFIPNQKLAVVRQTAGIHYPISSIVALSIECRTYHKAARIKGAKCATCSIIENRNGIHVTGYE